MTLAFLHKSRDNLSLFRSINEEIVSASEVTGARASQPGVYGSVARVNLLFLFETNVLAKMSLKIQIVSLAQ